MKEKSNLMMTVIKVIKDLKAKHGIEVKYIRCNNARENKAFRTHAKKGLGMFFEYITPNNPQQIGKVKSTFVTFWRGSLCGHLMGIDECVSSASKKNAM